MLQYQEYQIHCNLLSHHLALGVTSCNKNSLKINMEVLESELFNERLLTFLRRAL